MDAAAEALITMDREELAGSFCRGCGYCQPCPAGIEIQTVARISLLLRRSPTEQWFSEKNQKMVGRAELCLHCGACEQRCPYNLKIQELLRENLRDYREVLAGKPL